MNLKTTTVAFLAVTSAVAASATSEPSQTLESGGQFITSSPAIAIERTKFPPKANDVQFSSALCCWTNGSITFGCHPCTKSFGHALVAATPVPVSSNLHITVCCKGINLKTCRACNSEDVHDNEITKWNTIDTSDPRRIRYHQLSASNPHTLCCWWLGVVWPFCVECPSATSAKENLARRTPAAREHKHVQETNFKDMCCVKNDMDHCSVCSDSSHDGRTSVWSVAEVMLYGIVRYVKVHDPQNANRFNETCCLHYKDNPYCGVPCPTPEVPVPALQSDINHPRSLPSIVITTKQKATKTENFTPPHFPPHAREPLQTVVTTDRGPKSTISEASSSKNFMGNATNTAIPVSFARRSEEWTYKILCYGDFEKYDHKCPQGVIEGSICQDQCTCDTVDTIKCRALSGCSDREVSDFCKHGSPYWACGCEPMATPLPRRLGSGS